MQGLLLCATAILHVRRRRGSSHCSPGCGVVRPVSVSAWLRTLRWPTELRLTGLLSSCAPAVTWPSAIDIMLFGRLRPSRWLANRSRLNRAPAPPAEQPGNAQNTLEVDCESGQGRQRTLSRNWGTPLLVAQRFGYRAKIFRCPHSGEISMCSFCLISASLNTPQHALLKCLVRVRHSEYMCPSLISFSQLAQCACHIGNPTADSQSTVTDSLPASFFTVKKTAVITCNGQLGCILSM